MVSPWAAARGMKRMPRPVTSAAASGARTMARQMACRFMSAFHAVEVFDVDAGAVAEQHHQDGEPDGRLRRRHGEDEEHEHLPGGVVEVMRESDEVEVHRQQHQLDAHQEQDHVLAVEEDARGADGEQRARQGQEVEQGDHGWPPWRLDVSAGMETMRMRPSAVTRTCLAGSWLRVPSRRRRVSAMAATMPTSRITAAISKG